MMCRSIKKLAAAMVAVVMLSAGAWAQTWKCGAGPDSAVTATLSDGTLTVSGSGPMASFGGETAAPWYSSRSSITGVVIQEGVTAIGISAFSDCYNISSVTIPNSVDTIGGEAFSSCYSLTSITSLSKVPPIILGSNVFRDIPSPAACLIVPLGDNAIDEDGRIHDEESASVYVNAYRSANGWGDFECIRWEGRDVALGMPRITLQATGGTVTPTTININNAYGIIGGLPTPEKPGYVFNGWFTSVTGGYPVTAESTFDYGEVVIYAQWSEPGPTVVEARVMFYTDGGTVIAYQSETVNGRLASLPTPRKVGYIFDGWFTAPTGGDMVTTSTVFQGFNNVPEFVYAHWSPAVWDVGADTGTVTAALGEDGTLTISGNGAMADFAKGAAPYPHLGKAAMAYAAGGLPAPWYDSRDDITGIVIEDGVTSIGENACDGCVNLTDVTVGSGVTSIGEGAFNGCSALESIEYLGETPPSIDPTAFAGVDMESVDVFVPRSAAGAYQTALSGQGLGNIKGYSSVSSGSRVIPQAKPKEEATVIAPVTVLSGEFTAGPNPISRQSGIVNFFRQGKRVANCELRIYDATGNIVNGVKISDKAIGDQARRKVGEWDLRDVKGRQVSEGTYLVKGVVKTSDGKSEKVSLIIGIR